MSLTSGDSEEHTVFIPNDSYGRRSSCSTKSSKSNLDMNYKDYYEWTASAKEVRPITITENVDFKAMSLFQKLWWSFGTCLQMLSLTVLSIRTDRLLDWKGYLKYHWKHYSVLWLITLCGWMPQILSYIKPDSIVIAPITAYIICTFGLLYYIMAITVFFKIIGPWMRRKFGKATTLRVWEIYISIGWQVQTVGFCSLTLTTIPFQEYFSSIPHEVTSMIGVVLVLSGIFCKGCAIYMTGYNTYYWYDMILNTPNAYFVDGGIYKYCGSPTYTLGRFTGFGAAIQLRSIPLFIASIADLILINLFNYLVEQPSVKVMYGQNKSLQDE